VTESARREIVVVGTSLAGLRAAEELRREGYRGALTMVGAEPHFPPYDRPPLSKEVLGEKWELEEARLRLFEPLDATMRLGTVAETLDPVAHRLVLDDSTALTYDGLVIATGTAVRRISCPGSSLAGVHYFRTAEDCAQVREQLAAAPRVTVIGGGFIGSEVAAVCRRRGLAVTVVDLAELPMAEQVGDAMARYLIDQHRDEGVALRLGVGIDAIEGTDHVEAVRLADGSTIDTDLVIVGIGVSPETGWLRESGLVIDNGLVCDEHCRPLESVDIVAAGDVARWHNPVYGTTMRVEHWTNAVEQAEYAAAVLLHGADGRHGYRSVPYFWSNQYDMHMQVAGIRGRDTTVVEGAVADRKFVSITTDDEDRAVGVLAVNWPAGFHRHRRGLLDNSVASPEPA
jgi:3-phenylpropionate/trans-cinnamate dioxygenase ferredoxin reductase component